MVYECKPCKMQFETPDDFSNHQKKFCINSDYSKMDKLDEIYQTNKLAQRNQDTKEIKQQKSYITPSYSKQDQINNNSSKQINKQKYDFMTPDQDYKTPEDNYNRQSNLQRVGSQLLGNMQMNVKNQLDDIEKLKESRLRNNLQYQDDFLEELLGMKKEMEKTYQDDIYQIKKSMVEIEKQNLLQDQGTDLLANNIQKVKQLLRDREALRLKEYKLIKDFEEFQMNRIQKLERQKVNRDIGNKGQLDDRQVQAHISGLRDRKKNIEQERISILSDITRIERPLSGQSTYSQYDAQQQRRQPSRGNVNNNNNKYNGDGGINYYQNNNNKYDEQFPASPSNDILNQQQYPDKDQFRKTGQDILKPKDDNNYIYNYQQQQQQQPDDNNNTKQPPINIYIPDDPNQNPQVTQGYQQQQQQQPSFNVQPQQQQQPVMFMPPPPQFYQMQQQQQQDLTEQHIQALKLEWDKEQSQKAKEEEEKKKKENETPFSVFAPKKEFLHQNQAANEDLTEEERMLAKLQQEDVDQLRILSKIPVGTELYRFKMEQYKEQSAVKTEIQKIVLEQALQRVKKDYEVERRDDDRKQENERWIDDQRKHVIQSNMNRNNDYE